MQLDTGIPEAMSAGGNIVIDNLKDYHCEEDPNDLYDIRIERGGFCFSFPLEKSGIKKKECLRLWWKDLARKKNLNHIVNVSEYFKSHDVKYTVKYEYKERALKLENGEIIPGVVMEWVEGEKLMDYVKKHYRDSLIMKKLAKDFLELALYMNNRNLAHGDLSGDNIIVRPSGELCLVDYDSFYIDGFTEEIEQTTEGIPCYQHPERRFNKYLTKSMDYFSQHVIYLSLLVISEEPNLFRNDIADKGFLFTKKEICSREIFENSDIYNNISKINNSEIQELLKKLDFFIAGHIESVEPLVVMNHFFATYCGTCGHHFENQTDLFCPDCGKKRETL